MLWNEAKECTLRKWTAIGETLAASDPGDPVALMAEVNAQCALCDKAAEEAGGGIGKCERCLLYQQVGGCREFGGRLSERVAERDWREIRAMVAQAIDALQSLEVPGAPIAMPDPYVVSDLGPWLPSVDVHADADDLVFHADMPSCELELEVRLEGDELIVEESLRGPARAVHCGRVHLPFVPPSPPTVSRPGPGTLEVRIHIPA